MGRVLAVRAAPPEDRSPRLGDLASQDQEDPPQSIFKMQTSKNVRLQQKIQTPNMSLAKTRVHRESLQRQTQVRSLVTK